MKRTAGKLLFSPSDLIGYVESPSASWMDRQYLEHPGSHAPDDDDPLLRVFQKRGHLHERAYLAVLREHGLDVCEIDGEDAFSQTSKALADGREVIYQARLRAAQRLGGQCIADRHHRWVMYDRACRATRTEAARPDPAWH